LTPEERDRYANLILLCPTDHVIVDKSPEDYPVEKLHSIKAEHELWVDGRLAEGDRGREAAQLTYSYLVDLAVEKCGLEDWEKWASQAIWLEPYWTTERVDGVRSFWVAISSAVWPGQLVELERALQTLGTVLNAAVQTFLSHAEYEDDHYRGKKFYKNLAVWDKKLYNLRFHEWEVWLERCQAYIFEATRAANWLADCVRRYINPAFFATKGKFHFFATMPSDIPGDLWVVEYDKEELEELLDILEYRLEDHQALFPFDLR